MGRVILHCNSDGELYTFSAATVIGAHTLVDASSSLWHQHLGHPIPAASSRLRNN